jgi:hypothetical protein
VGGSVQEMLNKMGTNDATSKKEKKKKKRNVNKPVRFDENYIFFYCEVNNLNNKMEQIKNPEITIKNPRKPNNK